MERDRAAEQMAIRELTEISDYTSNTLANLYFLANSTNSPELTLTKDLLYLPLTVQDSFYTLRITSADSVNATRVSAVLKGKSWVVGDSWLVPGLKLMNSSLVEVNGKVVTIGCQRNSTGFYVWLRRSN